MTKFIKPPEKKSTQSSSIPAHTLHTSIAIRDAFLSVNIPFIEVHLTNIFAREPFRHHSYLSDIARGCIIGLGYKGYLLAAEYLINSN